MTLLAEAAAAAMGAGASTVPLESTDPEEIQLYSRLKERYDAETKEMTTESEKEAVYQTLKREYDQWLSEGHDADPHVITVGDVVQAPVDGLYFEGVVTHVGDPEGTASIDFGDHDIQTVAEADCRRVLAWSVLEIGDTVEVKEDGSALQFMGEIVGVNIGARGEPRYSVAFHGEEDAPEHDVRPGRVRKVRSARSTAVKRWKEAFHAVVAVHAFNRAHLKALSGRKTILPVVKCAIDHHHGPGDEDLDLESKADEEDHEPDVGLTVGDIVTAQPEGECLWFEGVVVAIEAANERVLVHLTNEDLDEHAGEDVWCPLDKIAKVFSWDTLEVGDVVKAQPLHETLWYNAIVLEVVRSQCDGHLEYTVQYTNEHDDHHGHGHPDEDEDHEVEHHLPPAKLRKVQSGRSITNKARWKLGGRMVAVMRAFQQAGVLSKDHFNGTAATPLAPARKVDAKDEKGYK